MLIYFNFRILLKGLLIVEAEINVKIGTGKCWILYSYYLYNYLYSYYIFIFFWLLGFSKMSQYINILYTI